MILTQGPEGVTLVNPSAIRKLGAEVRGPGLRIQGGSGKAGLVVAT